MGLHFRALIFHALLGVVIVRGGLPNSNVYTYGKNIRYTAQRVSGMIALFFIAWHVFHMHGWFHGESWLKNVAEPLMGAQFRPYSATSTAGTAIQASLIVQILYAIGILACVYHLANGIWTMGITWGVWTSPAAQSRANYVCGAFGVALAFAGLGALWGLRQADVDGARAIEDQMYEARVAAGALAPNEHKRSSHDGAHDSSAEDKDSVVPEQAEEQAESSADVGTRPVSISVPAPSADGP